MFICTVFGCNSDSAKSAQNNLIISFYQLPRDKKLKSAWIFKLNCPKSNLPTDDIIQMSSSSYR